VDRKSISGFIVMLDPGAVSWGLKKQTSVSLSMVEAEFVAASTAVGGMWLRRIKWLTDIMTKSLGLEKFVLFRGMIGVHS